MSADSAAGWFGKLSMLGDFASRRLSPDWVRACDDWVSAGLRTSRQELGDNWQSSYLAAPVWRFACAPGIWGSRWWFGILMPSCDSVGRYYPLVIAQSREVPPADRIGLDHLDLWWSHLTRCGLATLLDGATVETLESDLLQCPPWPGSGVRPLRGTQVLEGRTRYVLHPGGTPFDLVGQLALAHTLVALQGCSLWWPVHGHQPVRDSTAAQGARDSCTLCMGLPPAQAFSALLLGRW